MNTEEVELFGGPLDGQRRVVPTSLSAITVAQYVAEPTQYLQPGEMVPILKHRYVRRPRHCGQFTYDGTVE